MTEPTDWADTVNEAGYREQGKARRIDHADALVDIGQSLENSGYLMDGERGYPQVVAMRLREIAREVWMLADCVKEYVNDRDRWTANEDDWCQKVGAGVHFNIQGGTEDV